MATPTPGIRSDAGRNIPEEDSRRGSHYPRRRLGLPYLAALATVLLATLSRLGLDPILGELHPFTLYFAAVAITAWYGGLGPALLATVLSYFAADWFFISPRFEFNLPRTNLNEFMALLAFLFSCLAIAITSNKMRQALARSREKQAALEREIIERERVQQELKAAQDQLRRHSDELEHRVRERTAHLRETVRSLEGVCYHIAHDLRAPLRAIDGFTTILFEELGTRLDQPARAHLEHISRASQRMDLLIHGLLEYGRLGTQHFVLKRTNPRLVLDQLIESLSPEISVRKARVTIGSDWLPVMANETLLEIVFSNLVWNALKFVPAGRSPSINISFESKEHPGSPEIRQPPQSARITVADDGIGIAPEYLDRVFKIFERLHMRDNYPGTGMGLAISAKAVELMHGQIGVESGPNQGSRFWLELPLAPKVEDRRPQPPEAFDHHDRPALVVP